jgi:hypothetical protein
VCGYDSTRILTLGSLACLSTCSTPAFLTKCQFNYKSVPSTAATSDWRTNMDDGRWLA